MPEPLDRIRRIRLRTALLLAVVVPLALSMLVAGILGLRALERWVEERMEAEVKLVAKSMGPALARSLERGREGTIQHLMESAFRLSEVYAAHVYDGEGERIASFGVPGEAERSRMADLAAQRGRTEEYGELGGREVYSYFVPLASADGLSLGLLQVSRRRADFRRRLQALRRQGGVALVLGVGVMAGLVLVGHHGSVGRHLDRLGSVMSRVEAGDRDHRAPDRGPREIAGLAHGLNAMLDSVERARQEIERRRVEQVRLQEELRRKEKLAAVGRLAAGVAHELGSPLTVIDGKAQRLLRDRELDGATRRSLEDLRAEVDRVERIVTQLLEFGRAGEQRRRRVAAGRLADAAAASEREAADGTGTSVELQGPVPGPPVDVDPVRVERALANLIRNAVQAAPGGRVRVSWSAGAGEVAFVVEDDGPGVTPEARGRIFEPFFSTKRVGRGTGLGLAVVHAVAEEHDGGVTQDDGGLGGARFRLTLPAAGSE